jgi:hypothetical protein
VVEDAAADARLSETELLLHLGSVNVNMPRGADGRGRWYCLFLRTGVSFSGTVSYGAGLFSLEWQILLEKNIQVWLTTTSETNSKLSEVFVILKLALAVALLGSTPITPRWSATLQAVFDRDWALSYAWRLT